MSTRPPHLPTRCPLCKGAVIERTASGAHVGFLWFHCLFCNHWWKFRIEESYTNPEGDLIGEIFIVTKSGITYRLDSVVVWAIPEEVTKKHLEHKTRQRENEVQRLRKDIARQSAALGIARADEDCLWKILQLDESNPEKSDAWTSAYKRTQKITKQIELLQAERQQMLSWEPFFEDLPTAISMAKTDADGKFALTIPRQGGFVIAARGPRETFRDIEPYWFVRVSLDGEANKRLALTNDNVLDAASEAALRTQIDAHTSQEEMQ